MKQIYKRIVSTILALCVAFSLLPTTALAKRPDPTSNPASYTYAELYQVLPAAITGMSDEQAKAAREFLDAKFTIPSQDIMDAIKTASISRPTGILDQRAEDGTLIARWQCVGYQAKYELYTDASATWAYKVYKNNQWTSVDKDGLNTEFQSFAGVAEPITVSAPEADKDANSENNFIIVYFWDIVEDSSCKVTYELKSKSLPEGYTVYHAEDWGYYGSDGGVKRFGVPVCYFTGEGYRDSVTATAYKDAPIRIGMDLSGSANYPLVDFVARKVDGDTESYMELEGWKIKNADGTLGDTLYSQDSEYMVTADTTFVAQWKSIDTPTSAGRTGPKAPLATPWEIAGEQYDAKIEQSLDGNTWSIDTITMQNANDPIFYKATMRMNALIADTEMLPSVNGQISDPGFANFNICVNLSDGLELCPDGNYAEVKFTCFFLRPVVSNKKVYVTIGNQNVEATVIDDQPNWKIRVPASAVDGASSLVLPVEWRPYAAIPTGYDAYDMTMTAKVRVQDGSTAPEFTVSGSVNGKIDLNKAGKISHQPIRFILKDPVWNAYYCGSNGEVDIVDSLNATAQLDWSLNNIALTANTVTAKPAYVPVDGITLDQTTLNLVSNDDAQKTAQLIATVTPDNATDKSVTWSSENPAVATVDNEGKVTAVSAGTAIIRVTAKDGETAACQVTVTTNAEGVGLDKTEMALTLGGTVTGQLTATVSPDNATDKSVTWTSSDETIATVDGGVVRAVGTGTADVTASVTVNGTIYTATCKVTVTQPVTGVSVNPAALNLTEGETRTLTANVSPSTASDPAVTWTSSNPAVAAVDGNGVVTALRAGSATITATAGGQSATCTVTVSAYVDPFASYYPDYFDYPSNPGTTAPAQPAEPDTPVIPDDPTPTDPGAEIKDEEVPLSEIPLLFTDVKTGDWHRDAVAYVFSKGIMSGASDTKFEPDSRINRGMIVTMLHRLEGTPASALSAFTDVLADQYWAEAIGWASLNGIVQGYSDTEFRPSREISREQLASILYRYAQLKGYDTSEQADLSAYADAADVSGYALDGMRWAVAKGLISGVTESTLAPGGSATRAQAAMILMRFCENVVSA